MKILLGGGGATTKGWHRLERAFKCLKEYQYAEVRHITKPTEFNPDHFSVGAIFHAGRAMWFSLNFDTSKSAWKKIKAHMEAEALTFKLPATFKAERMAATYLTEYIAHWRVMPKPRPIAAEYLLGPAALKKGDPLYLYRTARLDDVGFYPEAGNRLAIGESKTTSSSINDCINQYTLHGQPILQYILWKMSKRGEAKWGPCAGTVLDITKKGYGGRPCEFSRVFIPWTDREVNWMTRSIREKLTEIRDMGWDDEPDRKSVV